MLAGGASRRMGRPKVLTEVDGVALGVTVAEAVRGAGATRVVLVGGEEAWAASLGLGHLPDRWPGIGPLGGIATAVAAGGPTDVVLVAACDQPALSASVLAGLVERLWAAPPGVAVAALRTPDGRRHPLPCAWRATAGPALVDLVGAGARRADAGFEPLGVVDVAVDGDVLVDLDSPDDVRAWQAGRSPRSAEGWSARGPRSG